MLIRFIWVGKTRNEHLRALVDEFIGRLKHFTRIEISEIRDAAREQRGQGIEDEGRRIISALQKNAFNVLLDVEGEEWSSHKFARKIEDWQNTGVKEVSFIIGGHDGVSREVIDIVESRLSLSRMTLTHEMARLVLVEQVYRSFTIINGLPYQK